MVNVYIKELTDLLLLIDPDLNMTYEEVEASIGANGLDNFLNNIGGNVSLLLAATKSLSFLESDANYE